MHIGTEKALQSRRVDQLYSLCLFVFLSKISTDPLACKSHVNQQIIIRQEKQTKHVTVTVNCCWFNRFFCLYKSSNFTYLPSLSVLDIRQSNKLVSRSTHTTTVFKRELLCSRVASTRARRSRVSVEPHGLTT